MTATLPASRLVKVIGQTTPTRHRGGPGGYRNTVLLAASDGIATVTATDLDLTLRIETDAEGHLDPVVLKAAATARLLATLGDEEVRIDNHDGGVMVTHGSGSLVLGAAGMPRDFPAGAVMGEPWTVSPDASRAIRMAATAASPDEMRPILTGVLIDTGRRDGAMPDDVPRAVGTDSYRLLVAPFDGERPPRSFLLPSRVARWLPDGGTTMTIDSSRGGRVMWTGPGYRVWSRTIDGEFPNYRHLVPTSFPAEVVIDADALARSLTRCVAVLDGDPEPMRLTLGAKRVILNRRAKEGMIVEGSPDAAAEEVPYAEGFRPNLPPVAQEWTAAFNPTLMLACVRALQTATVTFGMHDGRKPAILTTGDTYALLMPVRVT